METPLERTKRELLVTISSYWHIGTGRGAGVGYDAVVLRTASGLPILPGRALKGVLREALQTLESVGGVAAETTLTLFGTSIDNSSDESSREAKLERARFRTQPGQLVVSSALLGDSEQEAIQWELWAQEQSRKLRQMRDLARRPLEKPVPGSKIPEGNGLFFDPRQQFFRELSSTQIDEQSGMAKDKSLRSIEVTVPVTLRAVLEGPGTAWQTDLEKALPFVEGVGAHRNRGLGRAMLTLGKELNTIEGA